MGCISCWGYTFRINLIVGKKKRRSSRENKKRNKTLQNKKLTIETKRLNSMKNEARPDNRFSFHNNVNKFIKKSSAKRIVSWVYSHHNAIKNSVEKWKESSLRGTTSIIDWNQNANTSEAIDRLHCRQHKRWMDR